MKYVDNNDHDRIGQVEEKPDLNIFHSCSKRKTAGDRDVDGGQDHHAGDVHRHHQVIVVLALVCRLID